MEESIKVITRSSKHILKYQTAAKDEMLNRMLEFLKQEVSSCIDWMLTLDRLPSSYLQWTSGETTARWNQCIGKNALAIVKADLKKAENKRFRAMLKEARQSGLCTSYEEFSLYYRKNISTPIWKTEYYSKPALEKFSIMLDERFVDFRKGIAFDEFIGIKTPFRKGRNSVKINIPFKHHRASRKFDGWTRKKSVELYSKNGQAFLKLIYEKEVEMKASGYAIGIDQGMKKLLSASDGTFYGTRNLNNVYARLEHKEKFSHLKHPRKSRKYRRLTAYKNQLIDEAVNRFFEEHPDINAVCLEDLSGLKKGKKKIRHKLNRNENLKKMQTSTAIPYWSYRRTMDRIEAKAEENGVLVVYVEPAYTSQECSRCHAVDKKSRDKEVYSCQHCGFVIDADTNAAVNICSRGGYGPSGKESRCNNLH